MASDQEKENALTLVLDVAEIAVDQLITDDFVKSIPVVGTAVNLCRLKDGITERIFAAKIHRFLLGLDSSDDIKKKWEQKASNSPDEARHVGQVVALTLDSINDLKKAEVIGRLFAAFADDELSLENLDRIVQAIDGVYYGDLEALVDPENNRAIFGDAKSGKLLSSGLAEPFLDDRVVAQPELRFRASDLGKTLIALHKNRNGGILAQ